MGRNYVILDSQNRPIATGYGASAADAIGNWEAPIEHYMRRALPRNIADRVMGPAVKAIPGTKLQQREAKEADRLMQAAYDAQTTEAYRQPARAEAITYLRGRFVDCPALG